jgi:hypothetical protein
MTPECLLPEPKGKVNQPRKTSIETPPEYGGSMKPNEYAILIDLACMGGVLLLCIPVLRYLVSGWQIRRDKLLSYLNQSALKVYYEQFPYRVGDDGDLAKAFRKQFNYLYGRRHFAIPITVLVLTCFITAWGIAMSLKSWFHVAPASYTLPKIAVSALLGAFVWSVTDEFSRIRSRDLSPMDVYSWSFRFLLAVPFGFAFAAVLKEDVGIPVAFFLGGFPTQTLFTFARRLAVQRLAVGDQQSDGVLELMQLQSIDRSNAERFQDEGINTISTLAWADPIDLTIRTNFDFNYVLDCMSQALLWVYFQDKTKLLYPLSLRGAQETNSLMRDINGLAFPIQTGAALTCAQQRAVATVEAAAAVIGINSQALLTTFDQVKSDPYTQFIVEVWH